MMAHWKDVCRERNGPDVCDSAEACAQCKAEADDVDAIINAKPRPRVDPWTWWRVPSPPWRR